ncbi:hypothetical protein [Lactobacillus amylolyticus]|nr:hypothetical protein [Lactobacillus amylolyticus]
MLTSVEYHTRKVNVVGCFDFYLRQGMQISASDIDQDTNEKEYTMIFEK